MLYEEFIAGTGCRDTAQNFQVFKDLEVMYMNSDIPKDKIYEYGKKLVNNDLTEAQVIWNEDVDRQIDKQKEILAIWKRDIKRYEEVLAVETDEEWKVYWKRELKYAKNEAKNIRWNIRQLKECKYT